MAGNISRLIVIYSINLLVGCLLGFCLGLHGWAGTRKVKPGSNTNLDLLEQEVVSGSGISWAVCKSALWPRQITMPASNHSVFYRPDALPAARPI